MRRGLFPNPTTDSKNRRSSFYRLKNPASRDSEQPFVWFSYSHWRNEGHKHFRTLIFFFFYVVPQNTYVVTQRLGNKEEVRQENNLGFSFRKFSCRSWYLAFPSTHPSVYRSLRASVVLGPLKWLNKAISSLLRISRGAKSTKKIYETWFYFACMFSLYLSLSLCWNATCSKQHKWSGTESRPRLRAHTQRNEQARRQQTHGDWVQKRGRSEGEMMKKWAY